MAKRLRKPRSLDQLEDYKRESGWYLAAWRDFRGLTLEELADEVGTSKGVVSDLETGAKRANGLNAQRFKPDHLDRFSKALGAEKGHLLEVNPYTVDVERQELSSLINRLADDDLKLVRDLTETLIRRQSR